MMADERASKNAYQRAYYEARKRAGICTNCGRPARHGFVLCADCARRVAQNRRHDASYKMREYPSITFTCSKCGKQVTTDGIRDKRTRFCSKECEKRYWRHPPYERDMRHRK